MRKARPSQWHHRKGGAGLMEMGRCLVGPVGGVGCRGCRRNFSTVLAIACSTSVHAF